MNRCKNCIYFERFKYEKIDNGVFRTMKINVKYGKCKSNKLQYGSSYDEKETDKLLYEDSESYKAYLEVGQDFGCIHFKEKEGENIWE